MTDERTEELLFDINGKLASIETKLDGMSETLLKHESRLTMIEQNFSRHISCCNGNEASFKDKMLELLGKCLIIGLTVIASLTGAGSLIVRIVGH